MKKGTKIKIIRGKLAGAPGVVHEESKQCPGFYYVDLEGSFFVNLEPSKSTNPPRVMVSEGQLEVVKELKRARL